MRHAGAEALSTIEDVLASIRTFDVLTERKPGIFYRKSVAFLHFHEDPAGMFADVKLGRRFERFAVNTREERDLMLGIVATALED
jgi:hypothetical protein